MLQWTETKARCINARASEMECSGMVELIWEGGGGEGKNGETKTCSLTRSVKIVKGFLAPFCVGS